MADIPVIHEMREPDGSNAFGLHCEGHVDPDEFCWHALAYIMDERLGYNDECASDETCETCDGCKRLGYCYLGPGPTPDKIRQVWLLEVPYCEYIGDQCGGDCDCERVMDRVSAGEGQPYTEWEW